MKWPLLFIDFNIISSIKLKYIYSTGIIVENCNVNQDAVEHHYLYSHCTGNVYQDIIILVHRVLISF